MRSLLLFGLLAVLSVGVCAEPLHDAVISFDVEKVKYLLQEVGVDVNVKDFSELTALHYAASGGHSDIVKLLLEAGADVNTMNDIGITPICLALAMGHDACVEVLLGAGADVDLSLSLVNKEVAILRLLLEAGADPNAKDEKGGLPLHFAALQGYDAAVQLLLDAGADVNGRDSLGNTPLIIASFYGHSAVVQLCLNAGAEIDVRGKLGYTALNCAAGFGNDEVVRLLLEKGASVNMRSKSGETPLHLSMYGDNEIVVELLLVYGADVHAENELGKTAFSLAKSDRIVRLLLRYGVGSQLVEPSDFKDFAAHETADTVQSSDFEIEVVTHKATDTIEAQDRSGLYFIVGCALLMVGMVIYEERFPVY